MNLYITADAVGQPNHGGGSVTWNESQALRELGECEVRGRQQLEPPLGDDPWGWDYAALKKSMAVPKLVHFYAGTFSRTVEYLKGYCGAKITYTAAAHDINKSRKAHEELGTPYNYPHLTDPKLWERYVQGYLAADVLICPSKHSADVMRGFGAKNRIEIIPHGVDLPDKIHPLPQRFTVGYLGAVGPDKGLRYLLEAWGRLKYKDAELMIGGRDSDSPFVQSLIMHFAKDTNIKLCGWVKDVADFYAACSLYVQPSVSEGFGIEVLEAMAHNRAVLCSDGAGAADVLPEWYRFKAGNVDELVSKIDQAKLRGCCQGVGYPNWRYTACLYTWGKIRERYKVLWRSLL